MEFTEQQKLAGVIGDFADAIRIDRETAPSLFSGAASLWQEVDAHDQYTLAVSTPGRRENYQSKMDASVLSREYDKDTWDGELKRASHKWANAEKLVTKALYREMASKLGLSEQPYRDAFISNAEGCSLPDDLKTALHEACKTSSVFNNKTGEYDETQLETTLRSCVYWPNQYPKRQDKVYDQLINSLITLLHDARALQGDLDWNVKSQRLPQSEFVQDHLKRRRQR